MQSFEQWSWHIHTPGMFLYNSMTVIHLTRFYVIFYAFSLQDFFRAMREDDIRKYMKNLFVALNHVHKKKVIHRDVKPSNFIYCQDKDT